MYVKLAGGLVVILITGCAAGMKPGKDYTSQSFVIPYSLNEAYRRADVQARACSPAASTAGSFYAESGTAQVRTGMPPISDGDLYRAELRSLNASSTEIKLSVADHGVWDDRMIGAARRSIESGTVECRK
ncbi:BPTD_2524 family lipoprotein [Schauerella aestuarii]|uniref:BPTD_2524 family lipoprotein n=1 Tax=Schauerella aestuarii TaxID=2511204 RepID=UPI00136952F4|nr:hypothetical protein [Achromobacter aestuarii]MYZ44222.1 hypothetical protein [Achromobacter aestuarii]